MTQRDKAVWGERLEDRGTRAGHGAAGFMSPRSVLRGDSLGAASPRAGVRREVVWPCSLFKTGCRARVPVPAGGSAPLVHHSTRCHYSVRQVLSSNLTHGKITDDVTALVEEYRG